MQSCMAASCDGSYFYTQCPEEVLIRFLQRDECIQLQIPIPTHHSEHPLLLGIESHLWPLPFVLEKPSTGCYTTAILQEFLQIVSHKSIYSQILLEGEVNFIRI